MTDRQNFSETDNPADRTAQVVILGAGPAGLLLGNLLHRAGIDCVVLERADLAHLHARARAGFLAENTVRILERHGLAEGLRSHGRPHATCEFRTDDGRFRLDYAQLARGERHTVYPQQNLVADLLTAYLDAGGRVHFGTEALRVLDTDSERPIVEARGPDGRSVRWRARYVAGCDGGLGAARRSLPPGTVVHHHDHGLSWLSLLVEAPPSLDAVGYAVHERGFAGHMARTARITRYYLQCERGTPPDAWDEDRIWHELNVRMRAAEHGPLHRGSVVQRTVVDLECDVVESLRHGALLLAGDAASMPTPSAAKGANLAVLEAEILAAALVDDLAHGDGRALADYSRRCLEHIWRAQEFSHWMVRLLHAAPGPDGAPSSYDAGLRRTRLEALRTSRVQQDWFAENYVGL
ncbi:4-hydroxybenzoate 3-monooxygenase [Kitasatospora misakiensis]|uniref:4-hydroxybenzoate 3-monooxygenase n=1 Tax=Kitasatospora misakiensis TaxID=67330 RepID=A0ABW0WYG0_9ACTN